MAFDDSYRRVISDSEYIRDRDPRRTILPFFGFKLEKEVESSLSTYGGNTYVTQVSNNTFEVSKSDKGLYIKNKHYEKFCRAKPVFTDYELEYKVQQWLKKNGIQDIWASPYISPSVEDFHQVNGWGPLNSLFNILAIATLVIGILLSIVIAIFAGPILSILPEFMQDLKMQLIVTPFSGCVPAAFLLLIVKFLHNRSYRQRPLADRKQKYQDEIRARYYKGMVLLFGEEIGQGMKALSIAREMDQQK